MTKDKKSIIAIISIVVTSIGIIVPIVYDNVKDNSELEIKRENIVNIINKPSGIDGLDIYYKNEIIDNLTKIIIKITNNSNSSLIKTDFISPLRISLVNSSKIISYNIEEKQPINISEMIVLDSSRKELNVVFNLLNPSDYIKIGVLVNGMPDDIKAQARIIGIKNVTYTIADKKYNTGALPYVFPFLFFATVILIQSYREKRGSEKSFQKVQEIKTKFSKGDLFELIPLLFQHLSTSFNNNIINKIKNIFIFNDNDDDDENIDKSFDIVIEELTNNIDINKSAIKVLSIIVLIGFTYILYWIITAFIII